MNKHKQKQHIDSLMHLLRNTENQSLIDKLNECKTHLVYARLYLCARHEQSSWLRQQTYTHKLGNYAMLETQIIFLQQKLSLLCADVFSLQYHYATITEQEASDCKSKIKSQQKELPTKLYWELLDNLLIDQIDAFISTKKAKEVSENIQIEIFKNRAGFEYYSGLPLKGAAAFETSEVVSLLDHVKEWNIDDKSSLHNLMKLIGIDKSFHVQNFKYEKLTDILNKPIP